MAITVLHGHDQSGLAADAPTADNGALYYATDLKAFMAYDQTDKKWYVVTPIRHAGAPSDGTAGTHFGVAQTGALLAETNSGSLYINSGSLASPDWDKVGLQS